MNEQEKIALTFMALLAIYGEDNPKAQDYQEHFKDDEESVKTLIKVNIFYRELLESGIFG